MTHIVHDSKPRGKHNEDFRFYTVLGDIHLMVVGDFAQSTYEGLDKLAGGLLQKAVDEESLSAMPHQVMLAQLASRLNKQLFDHREAYKKNFQCCAVFAAIDKDRLHYLPIGDCHIAVRRADILLLLNGSVWVDGFGNPLLPAIKVTTEMERGPEESPSAALGISPEPIQPMLAQEFPLEPDDVVLLYSDGVDKVVSPARMLELLNDSASPEVFVQQVLSEVETRHGDDDRTLLIAVGKHGSSVEKSIGEEREARTKEQKEIYGQLRTIAERLKPLDTVRIFVEATNSRIAELTSEIKRAPTKSGQNRGSSDNVQVANRLLNIESSLKGLHEDYKAISEYISLEAAKRETDEARGIAEASRETANEAVGPLNETPGASQASQVPKGEIQKPATVAVTEPLTSAEQREPEPKPPESIAAGGYLQRLDGLKNLPGQIPEGAIYITDGNFKLIDHVDMQEPEWQRKEGSASDIFLIPKPNAPTGWLTASYLVLKKSWSSHTNQFGLPPNQPPEVMFKWITDAISDINNLGSTLISRTQDSHSKLHDWIKKATNLNPNLLPAVQEKHSKLRDYCRKHQNKGQFFFDEENKLGEYLIQQLDNPDQNQPIPEIQGRMLVFKQNVRSWSGRNKRFLIGMAIGVFFMLVAIFGIWYLLSPSSEQTTNRNANIEKPAGKVKLEYGADGRTLIIAGQNIRARVRPGKETIFADKLVGKEFDDSQKVRSWLDSEDTKGLVTFETKLEAPAGQQVFTLTKEIENKDCDSILAAINRKLPAGVRMDVNDLQNMNPRLKCNLLREGDEILIKAGRPR